MAKHEWRTVRISEGLVDTIEKFLDTKEAKRLGINTISGFVAYAIRKEID